MSYVVPASNKMLIQQNKLEYEEMRRRLLETEKKLRNLNRFDDDLQSVASVTISPVSDHRAKFYTRGALQQGKEAYPPTFNAVSDAFARITCHKISSAAPVSQKRGGSGGGHLQTKEEDLFESDSSSGSLRKIAASNKYERKLLCQNQRLLFEVERLVGEVHDAKVEVSASEKYASQAKRVPDLEDKMASLLATNKVQEKALSESEQHLEETTRRNIELQAKVSKLEGDMMDFCMELDVLKDTKKEAECQRDEALKNLVDTRTSSDDCQRRLKERILKMEVAVEELHDNLANVTQERDDLLEQVSDMQSSLLSQEAQINRLLNDLELGESKKQDIEHEKKKLREQVELLTSQLSKYENDCKDIKTVKKEKQLLEAELTEHRTMAQEIAGLLMLVQHNQNKNELHDSSGSCGVQNIGTEFQMWPVETAAASAELNTNNNGNFELNTNNNGLGCEGGVSMMGELRSLFINMDGEIQRLRYDLKQRDADDRTYQNLHDELRVLMEKVESGVTANQELEQTVCSLEDEKRSMILKIDECQQVVAERERQIQLLDTRLNERNHQVICLQEDNNNKQEMICNMRKQLDAQERQLRSSGSGSNLNAEQLAAAIAKIKELEEILCQKDATIQDLNEQIVKVNKEMRSMQQKFEKKVDCLNQQLYEYQKQTEQLTSDNEQLRQKIGMCAKMSEDTKRSLNIKESQNQIMEAQLEELKTTLEEKEKLHCKLLESYQQKISKANEQTKSLESALIMCRNEVKSHMETMEKIKNHFECELMKGENCIKHLKEELRKCGEDLKCRVNENCLLEQTNAELHNKLTNSYTHLKTCEQNACLLTDKLKNMENIMLKDKACYMKENEEMERRLTQAINSLQCAQEEINKLKCTLAEKSGLIDCLQGEKNSLCRDLAKCKEVAIILQDKLCKMEKDNQELCRQLQQKMDCIRDMEVAICNKEQEVKRYARCVEELQEKIKRLTTNNGGSESSNLQERLKACREEFLLQSKKLVEAEDALKRCQVDVQDKAEIIQQLNCTIEELSCRLHDRIARVDELEKTIENLNKDIEKRMKRVDEQLKKYECELCDKAKQIADIDDCLSRCQHNLSEKSNEACVLEQKSNRLISDLNACNIKLKESEDTRDCLGKALTEQRAETAEISQELRASREQLQQKHQELLDCTQNLCCNKREWEKCRRDCDELRNTVMQREMELQRLNEEKNLLVSKVAHLTCRLENETCQLQNQLAEMKCRLEKENQALRIYQTELEENNACLMQKFGSCQRQLSQVEKCCHQKIDCMNRELEDLSSKLADRDDQITQCKDCLALRDSEIMRLKLKLCNTDMCGGNRSGNNSNCPDYSYSTDCRFEPDDIGSPILLNSSLLQEWTKLPRGDSTDQASAADSGPEDTRLSEIHEQHHLLNQIHHEDLEKEMICLEGDDAADHCPPSTSISEGNG